jgi:hypothetical protein
MVLGFMDTEAKKGAQTDLMIQRQDGRLPLLASWRYGKGKSIAFTTDLEARWSRNWIPWSGLQRFWGRLLDWLIPVEENLVPAHEARVSFTQNRSILDLSVYEDTGANSHYRYKLTGKAGTSEGSLDKLAPGHFQAVLPVSRAGDYRIDLVEDRKGQHIQLPPIGYSLAYDLKSEMPRPQFNTDLLTKMAQATGGELNPRAGERRPLASISKSYRPLKQPLIVLVFCLFLFEVAFGETH